VRQLTPVLRHSRCIAAPATLLKQLLALGESERVELAHALLSSVDDHDDLSAADREELHAAIERSVVEIDAGMTVPFTFAVGSAMDDRASSIRWF